MVSNYRQDTTLIHVGSDSKEQQGFVNAPVYRGSTVLYRNIEELEAMNKDPLRRNSPTYGRFGTPASRAFESAMTKLEAGYAAVTTNSGLSANTTSLLSFVKAGVHILVADSVYLPTKMFCLEILGNLGVDVEFYRPQIGAEIESLIRTNTCLIFMESPGSHLFEIQDVPAICEVAKRHEVTTVLDNTWGTPLLFKAIQHGVDVSVHSATKYISGHSDSMLGVIVCRNESYYSSVRATAIRLGQCASADDIYMATRGLRTLSVRLKKHQEQALEIVEWLLQQPQVETVFYPPMSNHPYNNLFRRDFNGANGLFTLLLKPYNKQSVVNMLNSLELFGIGHSWGGFESLIVPVDPRCLRQYLDWDAQGEVLRIHIGFEDTNDLIEDLQKGFELLYYSEK